jgi:1-acylglycerone phosphate reductase
MPQPKSVLITGCSEGGIGPALVESFHAAGLYVYATARSRAKMACLEGLANVTLLELDVISQASIDAAVEVVRKETGSLDILVNNAGINMFKPVLDVSVDEGKRVFDVNIWGVAAMTQAFVPMLIAARGTVVNVSSIAGCLPAPWTG